MRKRIIDADALDKLIVWLDENHECIYGTEHNDTKFVKLSLLIEKLFEIANSVPEPQQDVDADGWRVVNSRDTIRSTLHC
jgi:hypothetical protein